MKPPRSLTRIYPEVTKCTDAKRPVDVEVTAKDVKKSTQRDMTDCAMARAICREWGADKAIIGMTYSYVVKGSTAIRFVTPDSVKREIVSFDRHKDFAAGDYHLAPVPPSLRAGVERNRSGAKKPGTKHQSKRRTFHGESLRVRTMRY
jgi:hypothetical protein